MGVIMEEEFILKKYFIQYMKNIKGLSDASVKHYIGSLSTISKFLRERNLINREVYEVIDIDRLRRLREIVYSDSDFINKNNRGKRMYSAGLNNYIAFAEGEDFKDIRDKSLLMDIPVPVKAVTGKKMISWNRSGIIRNQALEMAEYKCEVETTHESFIAERNHKLYMEGHHVIPIKKQMNFKNSLDVYANIVCLCPTCHRKIHYGVKDDRIKMGEKIYLDRADRLVNSGIRLSKREFLSIILY